MSVETAETSTELAAIENDGTVVAPVTGLAAELGNLGNGTIVGYSSITGTDFASRIKVVNAMSSAVAVAENLNKTINLKDVVIQQVFITNENTGVVNEVPRVTLIDADGTAYYASSDVIYKDLKNFFTVLGTPNNWPAPVPVKVTKEKAKTGHFFTLSYAGTPAK